MRIEILTDGTVVNTIVATEAFAQAHFPGAWRLAAQQDPAAAPAYAAAVVITSITPDIEHAGVTGISADLRQVDTSVGAVLSFTAELRAGDLVLPVDQIFRMPLVAADGSNDRRLIRVNFVQGVALFDVELTVSRHWRIDENSINLNLQPHERLEFSGLDVYVLE
ncbi:MAG: hypothetical protein RSB86_17360 [Comamonas sp.]|uniref:hypothetical protein n=1 Tax=Comamonas sp. TaxID=34028 RepID=UPI002FCA4D15